MPNYSVAEGAAFVSVNITATGLPGNISVYVIVYTSDGTAEGQSLKYMLNISRFLEISEH